MQETREETGDGKDQRNGEKEREEVRRRRGDKIKGKEEGGQQKGTKSGEKMEGERWTTGGKKRDKGRNQGDVGGGGQDVFRRRMEDVKK